LLKIKYFGKTNNKEKNNIATKKKGKKRIWSGNNIIFLGYLVFSDSAIQIIENIFLRFLGT
jgi:hypothetical protein